MATIDIRPKIVKRFEVINLIVIFIGVIVSALSYKQFLEMASPFLIGFIQLFVLIIYIWIILAISRKRSKFAKWIFFVFFIAGIPAYIPQLSDMLNIGIEGLLSITQLALQSTSIYFLFQPEFSKYLNSK